MEWFEDWFDSKYYHILYKNRDEKEAQKLIKNLTKYFKKSDHIIDIACGKGRHSLFLSSLGYDVTGIDLSENSIRSAKKESMNIPNLNFEIWDMRQPYKEKNFDVALNLFTSLGYFKNQEENQNAISAITRNLKKEGLLIIDFMNTKKTVKNLIKNERKVIDNIEFRIKKYIKDNYVIKEIKINQKYLFKEKVMILDLIDFQQFLKNCKMKIIDIFGDYNLEEFNKKDSERLIIIAKK